jgi:hypothetical protein
MSELPHLKPLHSDQTLSEAKLALFERMTSETLKTSLAPGLEHCLKSRPDGTMLDGHHRIFILRRRNEDVNALPREVIAPDAA